MWKLPRRGNRGKLGKLRRVSHSSHNLYGWISFSETKTKALEGQAKSSGQEAGKSVKTISPGHSPLAGFEVTTYGRFSGDHRGGVSKTVRRDLLGHEPKDITDDYTHSTIEMRRRAVARLCQAWGEDLTQFEEMSGKSLASA